MDFVLNSRVNKLILSLQFCISVSCHLCEIAVQVDIFFPFLWVWLVKSFITDNQSLLKQLEKSCFCSWVMCSNLEIQSAFPCWCQKVARLLTRNSWQEIADSIYLQLTAQYLKHYSEIKSLYNSCCGGQQFKRSKIISRISKILKATKCIA